MERTTRGQVEKQLELLSKALGRTDLVLDYYRGYRVETATGHDPFWTGRLSAREMYMALYFARAAVSMVAPCTCHD